MSHIEVLLSHFAVIRDTEQNGLWFNMDSESWGDTQVKVPEYSSVCLETLLKSV